jgi:hypothetical protein
MKYAVFPETRGSVMTMSIEEYVVHVLGSRFEVGLLKTKPTQSSSLLHPFFLSFAQSVGFFAVNNSDAAPDTMTLLVGVFEYSWGYT